MITKLEIENFRRIKTVSIEPGQGATIIAGENDAGKSSLIDAIKAAIGGKKHRPAKPIRDGARKAKILLETEEVIVRLSFTQKGEQLKVEGKDGTRWGSPQKALNKWWGDLSFDPLEFTRLQGPKQAEVLRKLVGLDFSDLDLQREQLYNERSVANRRLKQAEAAAKAIPAPPADTPEQAVSLDDLLVEQSKALETNEQNKSKRNQQTELRSKRDELTNKIAELQLELADVCKRGLALKPEVDALQDVDIEAIRKRMQDIERTNANIRAKIERARFEAEAGTCADISEKLSEDIKAIDDQKRDAIESAKYPVPGMTVTDDGVMLDGHPFEQASQSDQLRTSFAVGLALNPGKLMISKDGSLLGDKKLALVDEMAKQAGAQVFVEVVGDRKGATLTIEDGEVKA